MQKQKWAKPLLHTPQCGGATCNALEGAVEVWDGLKTSLKGYFTDAIVLLQQ